MEEGAKMEIQLNAFNTSLKEIPNWKAPGLDGIHGFWFKKSTSIHDRLVTEMNKDKQETEIPE